MYPKFLHPTTTEPIIVGGKGIEIPKCVVMFEKWDGAPIADTFGGKPCISIDGKPMFAELGIMKHFMKEGWQSRWIETYGKSYKQPIYLSEWKEEKYANQIHTPILDADIVELLANIAEDNGNSYSGCWDVLAWKNGIVLFAESKRTKKDQIRISQTNWLIAGLNQGLKANNFLIVQWDMI